MPFKPHFIGDDILSLPTQSARQAQAIADTLRESGPWEEVVPGLNSVAAHFDPMQIAPENALTAFASAAENAPPPHEASHPLLTVPVSYGGEDGPDFEAVCTMTNLTPEALIAKHTAEAFPVELIGFTPGFAYIGGWDTALTISRLSTPRAHVPAGSVGMITGYTGLYALAGPGGWPLIGRTDMPLFVPETDDPFRIKSGMRIQFQAV